MIHLARHLARRHGGFMAACALLLGLFQLLITAVVGSIDLGGLLRTVMASLPPLLQTVLQSQIFGGLTEPGLLAFGWNHPVSHALGTAAAIVLASRAIAGEVEAGTIELTLSQPLSRRAYLAACALFAVAALALVSAAGLAGTLAGIRIHGLEPLSTGDAALLAFAFLLLQWAWFGVALALSAFGREGGRVASLAFLVALASYLAQAIGTIWDRAAFVLPWTPHHYFSPQAILLGEGSPLRGVMVLALVGFAGHAVAAWRFFRRDLP